VRHIPPQDIYERLVNRLHVLTAGARDLPQRQRTLRTAIEWSYGLLEPDEAALFKRLAVFHNGVTLEAGEAVTLPSDDVETDTLALISSLVDKSLLRQVHGTAQTPRYLMLETVHDYAWEKLDESGESESMRRRHADYFVALAEQAAPELRGSQQKLWMDRLEDEHDNLRAALRWALVNDEVEIAARLGNALWDFWIRRSHLSEGRRWLGQVLALGTRVPATMRAKMLAGSGFLAFLQDDYAAGRLLAEESLRLHRELGDKAGIALSFTFLADLEYMLGDPEMALRRFEQALTLWQDAGVLWGIAKALSDLGEAARTTGDFQAARARYEESLAIRRGLNDQSTIAIDLVNLAHVAHYEGNYEQAKQLFLEGLLIGRNLGSRYNISVALGGLAGVAAREGQSRRAALLFGSAEAALRSVAGALDPADRAAFDSNLAAARAQLDEESWAQLWVEGQDMSLDQAIALASSTASDSAPVPQAQPAQASPVSGGLTRREREIAQLVAQGKSNREIGDALVIAERTVEGHVSNILSKLGFRSRAQISAWVVENARSEG
jgi:non-specific serine/threonine protein kinase